MTQKTETNLTTSIKRWIASLVQSGELFYGKVLKVHGNQYQEIGTPDLLISLMIDGHTVVMFVECKVEGGRLEEIQLARLKQWALAGMATAVVWSLEGFQKFYNEAVWQAGRGTYGGYYGEYK